MARELYAAGPGEVVIGKTSTQGTLLNASEELTSQTGRMVAIPDSPSALSVWDARSSGTQVTDLQYPLGTPITTVTPDSRGRVQFYGPDGETGTLWVQDESGSRWAVQPSSTADNVGTLSAALAGKLDTTGGTMTGALHLRTGSTVSDATRRRLDIITSAQGVYFRGNDAAGSGAGQAQLIFTNEDNASKPGGLTVVAPAGFFAPLPTVAATVPRLARTPDPATGDLGLPGFAGSDTGWRDLASLVDTAGGWSGTLYLRRTASTVTIWGVALAQASAAEQTPLTSALPAGFRPTGQHNYLVQNGSSVNTPDPRVVRVNSTGLFYVAVPATAMNFVVSFPTDDAWPTSLPGTQVSAPAAWT